MIRFLIKSFLLIFFSLLFACKNANTDKSHTVITDVQVADNTESLFEDIFDNYKITRLQTDSNVLIGNIKSIYFDNDVIIIPQQEQNSIYIFDTAGHFINKILKIGEGPQEYRSITDVFYDSENKLINVWDAAQESILQFDQKGNFIQKDKIDQPEQSGYLFYKSSNFAIFDRKAIDIDKMSLAFYSGTPLKYKSSLFKIPPILLNSGVSSSYNLDINNDSVYYCPFLSDTIYAINNAEIIKSYPLHLTGNNFFPEEKKSKLKFSNGMELMRFGFREGYVMNIETLFAFNKGLLFSYHTSRQFNIFYNFNSKQTSCFSNNIKRKSGSALPVDYFVGKNGNTIAGVILQDNFYKLEDEKIPNSKITDVMNPYLVFLKLK